MLEKYFFDYFKMCATLFFMTCCHKKFRKYKCMYVILDKI